MRRSPTAAGHLAPRGAPLAAEMIASLLLHAELDEAGDPPTKGAGASILEVLQALAPRNEALLDHVRSSQAPAEAGRHSAPGPFGESSSGGGAEGPVVIISPLQIAVEARGAHLRCPEARRTATGLFEGRLRSVPHVEMSGLVTKTTVAVVGAAAVLLLLVGGAVASGTVGEADASFGTGALHLSVTPLGDVLMGCTTASATEKRVLAQSCGG